jgi:hypothetical protein
MKETRIFIGFVLSVILSGPVRSRGQNRFFPCPEALKSCPRCPWSKTTPFQALNVFRLEALSVQVLTRACVGLMHPFQRYPFMVWQKPTGHSGGALGLLGCIAG